MTTAPDPQPPAAPECCPPGVGCPNRTPAAPEADVSALTDGEWSTIHALHREIGEPADRDNNWQPMVSAGEVRTLLAIADRHAALVERVRVAEGERDAERRRADWNGEASMSNAEKVDYWIDRAESAEAAHAEAEQHIVQLTDSRDRAEAAHERLQAAVTSVVASLQSEKPCGDACRAAEVAAALLAGAR
jgi:hypothetical protein